ncbi:hypothetical protein SAMN06295879_1846 [Agreia bicolorata]|uniref:Uncharacterized protein n=2 Tax=Agreia bicolorata TaxID=110935 RepID=A0A1T4XXI3_9MICO|nr:hypothetical protein SAMN06295879_1846 [Agreia bicolorata]
MVGERPPRQTRWRVVRRIVGIVVVLLVVGFFVRQCASMTIASLQAVPKLQSVVGDHGTVSSYTRESQINVTPTCTLTIEFAETASAEGMAAVLSEVAPLDRYGACQVDGANIANLSSRGKLFVDPDAWETISPEGWRAVAEKLTLPDAVWISLHMDTASVLTGHAVSADPFYIGRAVSDDEYSAFVSMLGSLTAGPPLEETIGPIRWKLDWSHRARAFTGVRITTDATTPPAELAVLLDALTPYLDGRTTSVDSLSFDVEGGSMVTHVALTQPDDGAIEIIKREFETSGLGGEIEFSIRASGE